VTTELYGQLKQEMSKAESAIAGISIARQSALWQDNQARHISGQCYSVQTFTASYSLSYVEMANSKVDGEKL
jgi:hypothetical protein